MLRRGLPIAALFTAISLAACGPVGELGQGTDAPGGTRTGGDGTQDGTDGTSGGPTSGGSTTGDGTSGTTTGIKLEGTYQIETKFNLVDALPPNIAQPFSLVLKIANSPGDALLDAANDIPVIKYVVDVLNLIAPLRKAVVKHIDDYINRWSGGMVATMHELATDVQAALKGLKTHNKLIIGKPDPTGKATVDDTLIDLTFTYKGQDYKYPNGAHAVTTAQVNGFAVTIPLHTYDRGANVGGLLVDLIDNVALPQLTGVNSLGALLNQLVNCAGVGTWIYVNVADICAFDHCVYEYLDDADFAKLCVNTMKAVGNGVEGAIESLDAGGMMSITEAKFIALDNKRTGRADTLTGGTWDLTLPVAGASIALPGTFASIAVTP